MKLKPHSMEGQKTVRIDERTVICVSVSIPDSEARERYLKKRETLSMVTTSPRWKNRGKEVKAKLEEIPEEIAELEVTEDDLKALEEEIDEDDIE